MTSRRQFVKGSSALTVASLSGLSGCLGSITGGEDFTQWLVDPFRLSGEVERYSILLVSPATFDEYATELTNEDLDALRGFVNREDFSRFRMSEVDYQLSAIDTLAESYNIKTGDFDSELIRRDLRDNDFRTAGEYEGYELYENDSNLAVGVEEETLLTARSDEGGGSTRTVEDIIDTGAGEIDRYQNTNPDFGTLIEESPTGDYLLATTQDPPEEPDPEVGDFRNMIGFSQSIELNEEESDVEITMTFEQEYEPTERDVDTWTRERSQFSRWRDISITIEEGVTTVSGTVLPRDVLSVSIY